MQLSRTLLLTVLLAFLVHPAPASAARKIKSPGAKPAASAKAKAQSPAPTPAPAQDAAQEREDSAGEMIGPTPQPGRFRLVFQPSIRFNRPKDLEDSFNNSFVFEQSAKYAFGPGVGASLGADYRVLRFLFAGLRLDYLRATNEKIRSGTVSFEDSLTTLVLMATASAELPLGKATRVGLLGGFGGPLIFRYSSTLSTAAGTGSNNGSVSYGSNQSATLVGAYLQQELESGFWVRLNLEWRSMKADSVKAEEDGVNDIKKGDILKANSNANAPAITVDAGGFTLGASLAFAL
jgi:hypothetical protein